jgi:hypothetical protein
MYKTNDGIEYRNKSELYLALITSWMFLAPSFLQRINTNEEFKYLIVLYNLIEGYSLCLINVLVRSLIGYQRSHIKTLSVNGPNCFFWMKFTKKSPSLWLVVMKSMGIMMDKSFRYLDLTRK